MCGIAGYFLKQPTQYSAQNINLLLNSVRQRGPDDEGVCLIARAKKLSQSYKTDRTTLSIASHLPHINAQEKMISHDIALVHARFAIIDLSEKGHQPFISQDGSIMAIFNGEIYNYIELRQELAARGIEFRTASDTEVLVEGYCFWKDKLWSKLNGFWATVLYDFNNNSIILSRDRIGVAPLYYRQKEEGFFFASSIQSLIDISPHDITLNDDVILGFTEYGIKDHDYTTYYSQIRSTPAATTITFRFGQYTLEQAQHKRYWDFPKSRLKPSDISFQDAVNQYRQVFFDAVKLRMRADVKIAFELSGGLDSSSVVAAACCLGNNNIATYTVKTKGLDEEPYARAILKDYPVDYHVLANLEDGFASDCGTFSKVMEEPYDNPSNYSHHQMLKIMKEQGIDVVITGAGGDEVLAGYDTSFWPKAYLELKRDGLLSFILADWHEFCRRFKTLKDLRQTLRHYFLDPGKFAYRQLFGLTKMKDVTPLGSSNIKGANAARSRFPLSSAGRYRNQYERLSFHQRILYHFQVALVPYYMRSSDHYTMNIPVEHRFPLLDYRMVELGLKMPISYLFRKSWTKYILREAIRPYLPKEIVWRRKKMGFPFPFRKYLADQKTSFEPLLAHLTEIDLSLNLFGGYEQLLRSDPILLWRLLSTAIWVKHNLGR